MGRNRSSSRMISAGLADEVELQVAYAIGVAEPVSLMVTTFGTGKLPDDKIAGLVRQQFPFRPADIIRELDLLRPIYRQTSVGGHFGRSEEGFTWERTDRAEQLRSAAGL